MGIIHKMLQGWASGASGPLAKIIHLLSILWGHWHFPMPDHQPPDLCGHAWDSPAGRTSPSTPRSLAAFAADSEKPARFPPLCITSLSQRLFEKPLLVTALREAAQPCFQLWSSLFQLWAEPAVVFLCCCINARA